MTAFVAEDKGDCSKGEKKESIVSSAYRIRFKTKVRLSASTCLYIRDYVVCNQKVALVDNSFA